MGNAGANSLNGTAAYGYIFGMAGDDTINGDNGNEIVQSGTGNNMLTGGTGSDVFKSALADADMKGALAVDALTDFSPFAAALADHMLELRDLLSSKVKIMISEKALWLTICTLKWWELILKCISALTVVYLPVMLLNGRIKLLCCKMLI